MNLDFQNTYRRAAFKIANDEFFRPLRIDNGLDHFLHLAGPIHVAWLFDHPSQRLHHYGTFNGVVLAAFLHRVGNVERSTHH